MPVDAEEGVHRPRLHDGRRIVDDVGDLDDLLLEPRDLVEGPRGDAGERLGRRGPVDGVLDAPDEPRAVADDDSDVTVALHDARAATLGLGAESLQNRGGVDHDRRVGEEDGLAPALLAVSAPGRVAPPAVGVARRRPPPKKRAGDSLKGTDAQSFARGKKLLLKVPMCMT